MLNLFKYLTSSYDNVSCAGAPKYSPEREQVAYVDEPFDFDFHYTAGSPPTMYTLYKDGRKFEADGRRVTVDHTGVIFTKVLHEDAGEYMMRAYTPRAGISAMATSTLKGNY